MKLYFPINIILTSVKHMDFSKYTNYDELFRIGDYRKLSEELKDVVSGLNFTPKLDQDQIIVSFYYFISRLELGKFSEVEKILQSKLFKSISLIDEISRVFLQLLQVRYCYELEKYFEPAIAFDSISTIHMNISNDKLIVEKIALICIYQSYLSYKKGDFDQFNLFYSKSTDFKTNLENDYFSTIYCLVSSQIYGLQGKTSLALSNAQESYEQAILTKNIHLKAYSLLRVADVNFPRGKINQALDNCESAFIIGKKLGNLKIMGQALFINAKISHHTMDFDQALELANKTKDYFKNFNFTYGLMLLNNLYGNINHLKGELDQALKYFEKGLKQAEELDKFTESIILNNIGNIYSDKGIFDSAIDNYSKAFDIASSIDYVWISSIVLSNLGLSYHLKADYKKSIEYYTMSLEKGEEEHQPVQIAGTYFNLIVANIELKNEAEITKYFDLLRILSTKDSNKLIFYYYEISRALIQKSKKGLNYFAEAQDILKRILRENIPHSGLKQLVIINLADLMIKELSIEPNDEILMELNNTIDKLYAHGKEQNIFHLIIEALILKSKITLVEGNIKQAERLLVQASILAEEKNLTYLENKSNAEYKIFRKQITNWAEMIENNTPLVEKMKLAEIQNYISDLQKIAFK